MKRRTWRETVNSRVTSATDDWKIVTDLVGKSDARSSAMVVSAVIMTECTEP